MVLVLGGCIHNEGYLKGVELQPEPVLGPEIVWALSRRGLQLNLLQIPQVMDNAASKQLRTGTYKLHIPPIGIYLYMSAILPVLGPKIARAQRFKGPKHEHSDLRAQNMSAAI